MAFKPTPIGFIKGVIDLEDAAADFIQNGPATGIGGHARDQYRKRCEQFSNAPPWAKALARGPAGSLGRVCKPYLDGIPADLPTSSPPFTGGQCANLNYQVQGTSTVFPTADCVPTINNFNAFYPGPIRGLRTAIVNPLEPLCTPGQNAVFIRYGPDGNIQEELVAGASYGATFSINSVTPNPPGPDPCGDLPPELTPGPNPAPDPGPTPGPEPTADPSNPTGPPLLPIPDYEDPIGGPVPIEGPEQNPSTIGPENIPGSSDSQEGGGQNAGDAIAGESGADGAGDDITFGPPPAGRVWVGALLQLVIPGQYGIIPNSGPANPVASRVVGNASLTYEGGRGTALRVRSGNIELFRPNGALKVTGLYVNCLPGITYTVRPISVLRCPENNCGETP